VTDDRLVPQALAYARFLAWVHCLFALAWLAVVAVWAVQASEHQAVNRVSYAVVSGLFLAQSIGWLWRADQYRRGARATVQALAGR
jgi:drug/metabolite transporter superfamily protein YnfA